MISGIKRVALFCMFSIKLTSVFRKGDYTMLPYSTCGLTKLLKSKLKLFLFKNTKVIPN